MMAFLGKEEEPFSQVQKVYVGRRKNVQRTALYNRRWFYRLSFSWRTSKEHYGIPGLDEGCGFNCGFFKLFCWSWWRWSNGGVSNLVTGSVDPAREAAVLNGWDPALPLQASAGSAPGGEARIPRASGQGSRTV